MLVSNYARAVGDATWFERLGMEFPELNTQTVAIVEIEFQTLSLYQSGQMVAQYPVSTSRYGIGSASGSLKTPLGLHFVRHKIGAGSPSGTVFRGRVDAGFLVDSVQEPISTSEDFVTTRILWLSGLEPGLNLGEGIDSHQRYIYIHGTHEEGLIGQPASHGCIRMKNGDVIHLFELMPLKSLVMVVP